MTRPLPLTLIVNHDSGPITLACARSLRHELWLLGGVREGLDVAAWDRARVGEAA